jgi:hypothetical protein
MIITVGRSVGSFTFEAGGAGFVGPGIAASNPDVIEEIGPTYSLGFSGPTKICGVFKIWRENLGEISRKGEGRNYSGSQFQRRPRQK